MKLAQVVITGIAFVCCLGMVLRNALQDRERTRLSKMQANRAIDEYEAMDGARIGQFQRFKV